MLYLMLVCTDPEAEPYRAGEDTIEAWLSLVEHRKARIIGDRLAPEAKAFSVGLRSNRTVVQEGPYLKTEGLVAGFDVLDCPSREVAIELASQHPMARFGRIELRPQWSEGSDEGEA